MVHLGGAGGKKASLEPSLCEEHPWTQKRQPTTLLVKQCVLGHPHSSFKMPIVFRSLSLRTGATTSVGSDDEGFVLSERIYHAQCVCVFAE